MKTISASRQISNTPSPKSDGLLYFLAFLTATRSGAFPSKTTGTSSGGSSKSFDGCAKTSSPISSSPLNRSTSTTLCPRDLSAAHIFVPDENEIFLSVLRPPAKTTIFIPEPPSKYSSTAPYSRPLCVRQRAHLQGVPDHVLLRASCETSLHSLSAE